MSGIPKRFIDSNIFIYVLSRDPDYSMRALNILLDAENGVYEAYTSTLVLSQVYAHLARRRRGIALEKFTEYISEGYINVVSTVLEDYILAVKYALDHGLNILELWDDLVIAFQMKRIGISEIYSNDRDFDEIPWVKRIF